jgi:hypothetical protein
MNASPDDLPDFPDPPRPSRAEWERVRAAVRREVLPRTNWLGRAAWAGAAIAAGVLVAVLGWPVKIDPKVNQASRAVPPVDLLAEYDVLPIATDTHLMVHALNGPNDSTLLTVEHPLKARMSLATVMDVTLLKSADGELNRLFLDTAEVK